MFPNFDIKFTVIHTIFTLKNLLRCKIPVQYSLCCMVANIRCWRQLIALLITPNIVDINATIGAL